MAWPALLTSPSRETMIWLAVTLILGGAAAIATGRALARGWQGLGLAMFYAAILAAASSFLCYALFHVSAIPMQAIASALVAHDVARIAMLLSVWAVSFVILALFTLAGWLITRRRMMRTQYGFRDAPKV